MHYSTISKKIFLCLIFMITIFSISSEEVLITEVSNPEKVKGSDFYPLFVNAKWTWAVQGKEDVSEIIWEIDSSHMINYKPIYIENQLAFRMNVTGYMEGKETFKEVIYVFEFDGYICTLSQKDTEYIIEKLLPINPKIEDEWINNNIKYNVAIVEDNMVKVEYITEDASVYGYYMYIKDVGPYKIYDYTFSGDGDAAFSEMTIIDNVSYIDLGLEKDNALVEDDELDVEDEIALEDDEVISDEYIDEETDLTDYTDNTDDYVFVDEFEDEDSETTLDATDYIDIEEDETETYTDIDEDVIEDEVIIEDDMDEDTYTEEDTDENIFTEVDESDSEEDIVVTDNDYIHELKKEEIYIQVGAYSVFENAAAMLNRARDYGYDTKIYKENGFYKVIISVYGNEKEVMKNIKESVAKDAFFKQR